MTDTIELTKKRKNHNDLSLFSSFFLSVRVYFLSTFDFCETIDVQFFRKRTQFASHLNASHRKRKISNGKWYFRSYSYH